MKALVLMMLALGACEDGSAHAQAVCALVDTSGTYMDQIGETARILRQAVLPGMHPGDSLVIARIGKDSYDKKNVEAAVTLGDRPSQATLQKSLLADTLAGLPDKISQAPYTDIAGGMMLCSDYLAELPGKKKILLVFSDMKQELPKGQQRVFSDHELDGISVVAMNVKRLKEDSARPSDYRARLQGWETLVKSKGSRDWRVVIEPDKLAAYLGDR